jgi:segregation and condensation protein B
MKEDENQPQPGLGRDPEEHPASPGETPPPSQAELIRTVEALLFAADAPLPGTRIADIAGATPDAVRRAVDELNRQYEAGGRTFRAHRVARGYQFYTMSEYAAPVRQLYKRQLVQRLSAAAHEILAIIAYRQPITRPEIEKLRGVDSSGPLVTLLERRLIATAGRARRPGSPYLYRTTREFLRYFGLESLDDLPPMEELTSLMTGVSEKREPKQLEIEPHEHLAIGDKHIIDTAAAQETNDQPETDPPGSD